MKPWWKKIEFETPEQKKHRELADIQRKLSELTERMRKAINPPEPLGPEEPTEAK